MCDWLSELEKHVSLKLPFRGSRGRNSVEDDREMLNVDCDLVAEAEEKNIVRLV